MLAETGEGPLDVKSPPPKLVEDGRDAVNLNAGARKGVENSAGASSATYKQQTTQWTLMDTALLPASK